jgi:septal ring factor EnvC (AmiA/AmiB activator)
VIRALALLLLLSGPALAQEIAPARQAAEAERANAAQAAERARDAAAEARRLAAERISGAARVQAAERAAFAAASRAEAARRAEAEARAEQRRLAAELAPLLPLLTRLAAQPAPILLAAPLPPAEVALGLAALRAMLREAQTMAEGLRAAEARAAAEARRLAEERRQLATAEAEARQASVSLDRQLDAARALLAERSATERDAATRAGEAVARAQNLEEALARLEREQARRAAAEERRRREEERRATARARVDSRRDVTAPPPPPPPPPPGAPEPAVAATPAGLPVAGQVIRGFNTPGEGGPARGLTLAAAPGARVTAPCGGSVAFAAPFRSYGRMVILDCGQGQHLVLAGMERLDVSGGQRIQAGEPVGVLPRASQPTLYVELRRRGEVVDPRPLVRSPVSAPALDVRG